MTAWHSEPREEAQEDEGWGVAFSAAHTFGERWTPYLRVGHSNGKGGALLRDLVSVGLGVRLRDDRVGTAVSWGRPPEGEGPDQVTVEAFYRLLLTPNVQITPAIHWTTQPSISNTLWVGSVLRVRILL